MMKKLYLLLLFLAGLFLAGAAWGQSSPDCSFTVVFTAASPQSPSYNNKPATTGGLPCTSWVVSYFTNGASSVSIQIEGAADSGGSPTGSYTALTAATSPITSANPATGTTGGNILACCDYYPWIRINPTTFTGTNQKMTVRVYGYRGTSQVASGGGGGGGGGTGNAASVVAYTPAASVTLTCPSHTAGTVTTFDPSGTALAANMALTFASCTTGQVVMVRVKQAASGGPYTVSGLPTGSPQISTYPSATTIYVLQASAATTMNFVSVAADSGATSLGAGANGISRTATAGSGGVTANLLAAKDTSNPTAYVIPAAGGCGSGVAAYSASAAGTFELYTVPGTVLTMVADGSITAGHLLTGGSSTPGRVADTGQTARTSLAVGTCIVGVALQTQGSAGSTLLVAFDGTGIYGAGAASSVAWNAITNPTGAQALTMGTNTTAWTYTSGTGAFTIANGGGNILVVDATNSRVGIGGTPNTNLSVISGSIQITSGGSNPVAGNGLDLTYSGTEGYVTAIDRGSTTFRTLGLSGSSVVTSANGVPEYSIDSTGSRMAAALARGWSSTSAPTGTIDTTLCRASAGVVEIGSGTGCGAGGALNLTTMTISGSSFGFNGKTCTIISTAISCS